MTPEAFQKALAQQGISLDATQMEQFAIYYRFLVAENEKMNLTAITAMEDVYLKHFYDSLTLAPLLKQAQSQSLSLCDVGAGAGFPSIPLKIAFPKLNITIVDALQKRIGFLTTLVEKLHLGEVHLFHDRAETFGGKQSLHREAFDVVTARAVAPLNVLAEFCLPLTKVGGRFIAMKAATSTSEVTRAQSALQVLGGHVVEDVALTLPASDDMRHLIVIDKTATTPARYPRKPGTPSKRPLGGE